MDDIEYSGFEWDPIKTYKTPQEIAFMMNVPTSAVKYIEKNKMTVIFQNKKQDEKKAPVGISLENFPRSTTVRIEDFN